MTMKKILLSIAAILALAGCAKEKLIEAETPVEGGLTIIGDISTSRTAHSGNELEGIKTTWVADDAIGVYGYKDDGQYWLNYKGVAEADSEIASFNIQGGNILAQAWKDYSIYAYYPFNSSIETVQHMSATDPVGDSSPEAIPFTVEAVQSQVAAGDMTHLASSDFLYGSATNQWDYNDQSGISKKIHVTFHHALSVLEVALTSADNGVNVSSVTATVEDENEMLSVSEGTINLATGELTVTAGTPSVRVQILKSAELSSTPSKAYLQITPGHAGKVLGIYAFVNGVSQKLGSVKVPASGIPAGVKASLSYDVAYSEASDITDLSEGETSNCYIINTPGQYKFKATVKGNGVVPAALTDVVGGTGIAPKSVLVLWYNTIQTSNSWTNASPVVISSVQLTDDGYIQFFTPETFVPGNVVIAAFAEEGLTYDNITADENYQINNATLLWSWNIWASEGYDPENSTLEANGVKIMDRNLGALISGTGSTGSFLPAYAVGNFYQWGRKDPIPPFADYAHFSPCDYGNKLYTTPTYTPIKALRLPAQGGGSNVMDQIFGYTNESGASVDTGKPLSLTLKTSFATAEDGPKVFTDYVTQNPHKFISGKYQELSSCNYGWISGKDGIWDNLWGNKNGERTKTVYDPCPAGWRVWDRTTAVSFFGSFVNEAVIDENLHGYNYKGCYFPLTAYRHHDHGKAQYVSATGYKTESHFWTSEAYNPYEDSYITDIKFLAPANYNAGSFTPEFVDSNRSYNADGMQLRCVKE